MTTGEDPLVGKEIAGGRYFVVNVLGRGGMGTVYTALQRPVDRKVALKIIHRELAGNPDIVARFTEEMRTTAAIEHPHTVRVYDFGDIDGQPFLTTEFLDGRSLRDELLRAGPVPQQRVASICAQIARALRAAHARGVVHRDLKPENIMLLDLDGEADYVKVLDFGIARSLHRTTGMRTGTGALLGTPAYMSPEQCEGKPVDGRSDLYTLGLIAYELATGALPFPPSDSVPQLLLSHVTTPPPDVRSRAPQLSAGVAAVIMRLLAKAPDQRFASAEAVIEALEPFLPARRPSAAATAAMAATEMGTGNVTAPPAAPSPEPSRRHHLAVTLGVTAVLTVVLGLWLWGKIMKVQERVSSRAQQALAPDDDPYPAECEERDRDLRRLFEAARAPGPVEDMLPRRLSALVAACPESARARILLARTLSRMGDDDAAEAQLREALALAPRSRVARFNLAVVLLKRERPVAALPLLDEVLKEEPAHPTAHLLRGQARLKNNDASGARADLEEQTRRSPRNHAAWMLLSQARRALGDEPGARAAEQQAATAAGR